MRSGPDPALGALLAEGRTAEVYAFGEDRVVKLLRPGFSEGWLRYEAEKTKSAVLAGALAPRVYGEIEWEGRLGVVFDRVGGASLFDEIMKAPYRFIHWGRQMAKVHLRILESRTDQLPDIKVFLAAKIHRAKPLGLSLRRRLIDMLYDLRGGDHVLHGDFHPLNIFLTESGPVVIDWMDAARGPPAADIARSLWLVSPNAIPPELPRRSLLIRLARGLRHAYLRSMMKGTGLNYDQVRRWCLPVLAGRLSEGIDEEEEPLIRALNRMMAGT